MNTIDLTSSEGIPIYEIVEKLLSLGQKEKVVTMSTQEGNIAIYNVSNNNIVYTGYIDISNGELVLPNTK